MKNTAIAQSVVVDRPGKDKNQVVSPVALYNADGTPWEAFPAPPTTGTYHLVSTAGVLSWELVA